MLTRAEIENQLRIERHWRNSNPSPGPATLTEQALETAQQLYQELDEYRDALEYLVSQDWLDDPRGVALTIEKADAALREDT